MLFLPSLILLNYIKYDLNYPIIVHCPQVFYNLLNKETNNMKLMIASDIHGSAYYCERLMKRFYEEKPDKLLLLGDILYHGPRNDLPKGYAPKKVVEMLNSIKDCTLSVRGNCEAEVDQVVLEFPIMADYTILNVNGITITATHGHTYNQKKPLPFCNEILLCGHTHVPACEVFDNFTYLNPGSVSMPKNDTKLSYMILEDRTFVWKDLMTSKKYAECTVK
jgi:putative phosphoesterase